MNKILQAAVEAAHVDRIEKAKGLLPKGGSRLNSFVAHRKLGQAREDARSHFLNAFNDPGSRYSKTPLEDRLARQRAHNEEISRKKSAADYLAERARRRRGAK